MFPQAPEPWIDLSTGINPEPYPISLLPQEVFTRLPEPQELARLEAIAARRYGIGAHAHVVAAPGTQALIQLLPQLLNAKRVGILGFTYGEYARVFAGQGITPTIVADLDALAGCDLAILVNPNNPDGRLVEAEELAMLARRLAARGGLLVVDEAFIDLLGKSASLAPILPEAGAVVLRSFGKTYGLAGLRLGFAIANQHVAQMVRDRLGPWAVSGPALALALTALADDAWIAAQPQRLAQPAALIDRLFETCGAEKIGGTPLFRLFRHAHAERLFAAFGRHGVWLRRFPDRPQWLRAGLPAFADADRLAAMGDAIREEIGG